MSTARLLGVCVLLICCCVRCSDSKQIAMHSNGISALAHSSRGRFGTIEQQAASPRPDLIVIREQASLGRAEQAEIIASVAAIVVALPGVEDSAPWWATTIAWVVVGIAVVAVCVALMHSGILSTVRGWVSWLTPRQPTPAKQAKRRK